MYGWRGRVGYIPPGNLEGNVVELRMLFPEGVAIVASVLGINKLERTEFDAHTARLERSARELADLDVDVIAMSGGPVAYSGGPNGDRALAERLERASGKPAFHDVSAVVEGLRRLGARRIAFASPFSDEVNADAAMFLEAAGFEIRSVIGLGVRTNAEIRKLPTQLPYDAGRRALLAAGKVDALFISCAGWGTLPSVRPIEQEFGVPVVTQLQALAWRALDILGIAARPALGGKLFDTRPVPIRAFATPGT